MKRIIIICEGQTEREFCNDVLHPHFSSKNIFIETPLIKKSKGGIVSWETLYREISIHLKQNISSVITTFFDYYGIHPFHQFPYWEESINITDKYKKMDLLEKGMYDVVNNRRFIPYIQLHEFEGLLFNTIEIFQNNFSPNEINDWNELKKIITNFPNPELINDSPITAPSKRLLKLIKGYNKIVYGASLTYSIGLNRIREKCIRFDNWISKLENI